MFCCVQFELEPRIVNCRGYMLHCPREIVHLPYFNLHRVLFTVIGISNDISKVVRCIENDVAMLCVQQQTVR